MGFDRIWFGSGLFVNSGFWVYVVVIRRFGLGSSCVCLNLVYLKYGSFIWVMSMLGQFRIGLDCVQC